MDFFDVVPTYFIISKDKNTLDKSAGVVKTNPNLLTPAYGSYKEKC